MMTSSSLASQKSDQGHATFIGHDVNTKHTSVMKRSSKACQYCRVQKIRCNVPENGPPCNKCRHNKVDCTASKRREQKKHTRTNVKRSDQENRSSCSLATIMALVHGRVNPIDIMSPAFAGWNDIESSKYQDQNADNDVYHEPLQGLPHRPNIECDPAGAGVQQMPAYVQPALTYRIPTTSDFGLRSPLVPPILNCPLPAYVKPLPDGIAEDDMRYLWRKGALSIPEQSFRNGLLRSYFEFVHPYMPLIELHDFLRIIDKNGGETVSLLLFQAVMFAGSAFVDMTYLYAAGFTSRKAARKTFYQRTKLLYDFNYEADPLVLVQSLLLMTYWYETPHDKRGPWHWFYIATSLAYEIGLHKNQDSSSVDFKEQGLRKRVWWSCVMRDCQLALGTRRRTTINRADFNVSMLTLDDFRIECLANDNLSIAPKCTVARDRQMQRDLAVLCIAHVKLCVCIRNLWVAPYPVVGSHAAQDQQASPQPNSMSFPENLETYEVKDFDVELMQWAKDLPTSCHYQAPSAAEIEDGRSCVFLSQALLHMLYLSAVLALNMPRVSASAEATRNQENCSGLQDHSHRKLREASQEISKISMDLVNLNLERYLPPQGVTVLLHAISGHLFDAKSVNGEARQKALRGFSECIHVLKSLRDNYPAADYACRFLEVAKRKLDADFGVISEVGDGGEDLLRVVLLQSQGINNAELSAGRHSRSSPLSYEAPHEGAYILGQQTTDTQADTVKASKYRSISFNGNSEAISNFDTKVDDGSWESRPSMTLTEGMLGESGGLLLEIYWMTDGGEELYINQV